VIGFALLVFIFILFFEAYQKLGTVNTEAMTDAESVSAGPGPRERAEP